ncbi:putative sodium-coupled neutral amino acid transporter 11 [Grus japonensis]|uniref:Putative sodium-coupled neutral amino acid transporter 11 n=1 Tax=Grus japonensis TaxID=30415 RepID=A0ABC9X2S3_GRUJA
MERGGPEPLAVAAHQVETDDQTALVSKPRNKGGNSDLASAGFNIINSIIGSGIIGLPYSMKEAGFPLGVLLLFGVAYITVGPDNVLTDRHFIILLTTIIFTLPISLYRDIAKLGKVSLISLILTIVILIIVMMRTVTFSPQV